MRVKLTRRRVLLLLTVVALMAAVVQLNRTQLWEDSQVYAGWRVQHHAVLPTCRLLDDRQRVRTRGLLGVCAEGLRQYKKTEGLAPRSPHLVILLHGMGRSPVLFRDMERALRAAGYDAVAVSYPSLTKNIAGHADQVEQLLALSQDAERVSFVTHSLGGLVVREVLSREGRPTTRLWRTKLALGRVVMIAPPNQGSELAKSIAHLPPYHWIGGPAASEIAAGPPFAPVSPRIEVAVIAGGTTGETGFNPLLSGNNDGVVTVSETRLPGASDHIVVRALHTVIASHPETIAATRNFLETGRLP